MRQKTFERLRSRRKIANQPRITRRIKKLARTHELSRLQVACDIEHGLAFAYRERLLEHLSVRDLPENIAAGHRVIKEIFACLKRALRMAPRVNLKSQLAAHHTIFFQDVPHIPARCPAWHINEDSFFWKSLVRVRHSVPHPPRNATGDQRGKQK